MVVTTDVRAENLMSQDYMDNINIQQDEHGNLRPGPYRAATTDGLTLRACQHSLLNKDVPVASLWEDRQALVILLPDPKTLRCRDMLLSAALVQAHLRKVGVPLCLIVPSRNPTHALELAGDFSLNRQGVEVYADTSRDLDVYEAFGMNRLRREPKRTNAQIFEEWGYYMLRAWCGTATNPMCCMGWGCSGKTNYLGGVMMLGPGAQRMTYRCLDTDGKMRIDIDVLMAQSTKSSTVIYQKKAEHIFVPV